MNSLEKPNQKSSVLLIYSGGTIGSFKDVKTGALSPVNFDKIQKLLPEISDLNVNITVISFENPLDSSNVTPDVWIHLATIIEKNYSKYDGFVILHGTDTMAYTASALSFMIQGLTKPIIFTGSQLPVNIIRTDGRENLITAFELAALKENGFSPITEVCIYFEYKLFRANRTLKTSAEQFDAFESPNYPKLAEAGVHISLNKKYIKLRRSKKTIFNKKLENSVFIVKIFPGMSLQVLKLLLENAEIKALILETFGSGNAPISSEFTSILKKANEKGIILVNITQCLRGKVEQSKYAVGKHLEEIGVIGGSDITTESAVCKLMYLLGRKYSSDKVKKLFLTSLRGEMTRLES